MEKIWNKLKQGLADYCRENGFTDVALGLSGGLDSAMVAVLAADALGGERVHAVMMKTRYTSELSLRIAREIAELNGLDYRETDIQPMIDTQAALLHQMLSAKPKQIVLENLQARERGMLLMAMSNQCGYLVLACGNKSEALIGYCTLYGDTCGGIAPIGNIYKSDLFALAKWRNGKGRALPQEVIERAPSAELSAGQKDEDSLPPYDVLDRILRAYADEGKSEAEVITLGADPDEVRRVAALYHRSAFKRKQMAPAL